MDNLQTRKQIEVEKSLDNLARYLDGLFRIPGTNWRFGLDAFRWVNTDAGSKLRLRGLNARVVVPGVVRRGDAVMKLAAPQRDDVAIESTAAVAG